MSISDWICLTSPLVTGLLTYVGYFFGSKNTAKSAEKKELLLLIQQANEEAVRYWASSNDDQSNTEASLLLSRLRDIEGKLRPKSDDAFLQLKQAMTDGSFQSLQRTAAKYDHPRFTRIDIAKQALIKSLE
jgi:hypothetical protein